MSTNPYESPETMGHEAAPKANRFRLRLLELLAVVGVLGFIALFLLPSVRSARAPARRMACHNNLKQIAFALQNYQDKYACLPPAYTVDEHGKPLHSWRTLLLPFLEESKLYEQIDLTKPWDDPVNQEAFAETPRVYLCPAEPFGPGHTGYLAVVAPGGCFAGQTPRKLSEISDKHGQTLMVIEVSVERAVPWMSPQDADEEIVLSLTSDKRHPHPYGAQAIFADGSTQFLTANTKPEILRAMISIAGDDDKTIESGSR
jgi:type II secretory pathway pseudopilin PulG